MLAKQKQICVRHCQAQLLSGMMTSWMMMPIKMASKITLVLWDAGTTKINLSPIMSSSTIIVTWWMTLVQLHIAITKE